MKLLTFSLGGGVFSVLGEAAIVTLVPGRGVQAPLGVIGAVVDAAIDAPQQRAAAELPRRSLNGIAEVTSCRAAEVPSEIVQAPGWPPVTPGYQATIYPRGCFHLVKVSVLRGLIAELANAPGKRFLLAGIPFWRAGAARTFLGSTGYPLG